MARESGAPDKLAVEAKHAEPPDVCQFRSDIGGYCALGLKMMTKFVVSLWYVCGSVVVLLVRGQRGAARVCLARGRECVNIYVNSSVAQGIRLAHEKVGSMSIEQQRRWCLFTSAGSENAIRLWLKGDTPRRWDLVVAYYGDNDLEFSEISKVSSHAFRSKGGKFQNLKKLVEQSPGFFDQYSHVWVCDDDIRMSAEQIDEAFAISELLEFWVAQPAVLPNGKISHPITRAWPPWDYRLVNFVEISLPIFRRDKLVQFLAVYDGSLTGWGIDYWYMNFFNANEFARFAIIDKVPVTNPHDEEKGGSEIDRLEPKKLRRAAWIEVKARYDLVECPNKVFAHCKIAYNRSEGTDAARDTQRVAEAEKN
jgi:hypothetical protein